MKRLLICSVAALAILAAAGVGLTEEEQGHGGREHRKRMWARHAAEDGNTSAAHDAHRAEHHGKWARTWRAANDANAPGLEDANRPHRRRHGSRMWRRAFRGRIQRMQSIRELAAEEGATKTVEALDELIGNEKAHVKKMMKRMRGRRKKMATEGEGEAGKGGRRHKRRIEAEVGCRHKHQEGKADTEGDQ
jgi:hypothetical protein